MVHQNNYIVQLVTLVRRYVKCDVTIVYSIVLGYILHTSNTNNITVLEVINKNNFIINTHTYILFSFTLIALLIC